jgi:hypothetical protein
VPQSRRAKIRVGQIAIKLFARGAAKQTKRTRLGSDFSLAGLHENYFPLIEISQTAANARVTRKYPQKCLNRKWSIAREAIGRNAFRQQQN